MSAPEDRRHPATASRRRQAVLDGDSAKSQELAVAIQILAAVSALYFGLPAIGAWLQSTTQELWSGTTTALDSELMITSSQALIQSLVWALLPILIVVFLFGWISHWLQSGVRLHMPRSRMFSANGDSIFSGQFPTSRLLSSLVTLPKIFLAIVVAGFSIWTRKVSLLGLGGLPVDEIAGSIFQLGIQLSFEVAIALCVASILDYVIQRRRFENRIRMTDQELRDEMRSQNGDPIINQQRQRQSRRHVRADVFGR